MKKFIYVLFAVAAIASALTPLYALARGLLFCGKGDKCA